MSWDCGQLNARLSEYLEGQLAPAEQAGADAHARACPRCGEHFLARQATGWLRGLERLESPPGLETRILALTVAPPPRSRFAGWAGAARAWQALVQPRVALGTAAAVLSVVLVANAFNLQAADLNPVNLYRGVKRQGHLTYARGTRFVNDLRLVYEIRTRLETLETEAEPLPAAPAPTAPARAPEKDPKKDKPSAGVESWWLLAYQNLVLLGELR